MFLNKLEAAYFTQPALPTDKQSTNHCKHKEKYQGIKRISSRHTVKCYYGSLQLGEHDWTDNVSNNAVWK